MAVSKKSTFLVQSSWNLVKIITSSGNYFDHLTISWGQDKKYWLCNIANFWICPVFSSSDFDFHNEKTFLQFQLEIQWLDCMYQKWSGFQIVIQGPVLVKWFWSKIVFKLDKACLPKNLRVRNCPFLNWSRFITSFTVSNKWNTD